MKKIIFLVVIIFGFLYANTIYKRVNNRHLYVQRVNFGLELSKEIDKNNNPRLQEKRCESCKIDRIEISNDSSFTIISSNPKNIIKFQRTLTNNGSKWSCTSYPNNYNGGVCKSANK